MILWSLLKCVGLDGEITLAENKISCVKVEAINEKTFELLSQKTHLCCSFGRVTFLWDSEFVQWWRLALI